MMLLEAHRSVLKFLLKAEVSPATVMPVILAI
jgi:hypothetical protein